MFLCHLPQWLIPFTRTVERQGIRWSRSGRFLIVGPGRSV